VWLKVLTGVLIVLLGLWMLWTQRDAAGCPWAGRPAPPWCAAEATRASLVAAPAAHGVAAAGDGPFAHHHDPHDATVHHHADGPTAMASASDRQYDLAVLRATGRAWP
jgi:ABC-type nickel/cobalt efflux system permease component RcnA